VVVPRSSTARLRGSGSSPIGRAAGGAAPTLEVSATGEP
jgi:hypothetical protein